MIKLTSSGVFLVNGKISATCDIPATEARKNTIAYSIMNAHNISNKEGSMQIKFDALTSHDITYVGIIQTARDHPHHRRTPNRRFVRL